MTTNQRARRCATIAILAVAAMAMAMTPPVCHGQQPLASGGFNIAGEAGSLYIGDQHNPEAIAFGDGFLVLWDDRLEDREDIFARVMDKDGEWLGDGRITVTTAAGVQKRPAVVELGGRALAVWEDGRNGLDTGSRDLYATFLEADGVVVNPRGFLFVPTLSDKSDIELAVNGEIALAVWEDRSEPAAIPLIMVMRFDADGRPLDMEPTVVGTGVEPVIAAGGDEFMLVYQAHRSESQALMVQRISADVSKDPLIGANAVLYAYQSDEPTIAWDGEQFAAAWIREREGSSESLEFSRIGTDGTLVDVSPVDLGFIHEKGEVDLVADGRGYVIVANAGRACTATIVTVGDDSSLEIAEPVIVSQARNFAQDPSAALASDGTVLITWEDELWEFGGNSSGFGENLFHTIGDPLVGFAAAQVMASVPGEFPEPRRSGHALVSEPEGIGVLWRTNLSENTAGSVFYSKTGASGGWQTEPELIGSSDGSGIWALELGGRTLCYWASSYWLTMMDLADIGTGASERQIYSPLDPGGQTVMASDGEDVFVLSTVPTADGLMQPVLSVLDDGEVLIASSPAASYGSNLGGIVAHDAQAFLTYRNAVWVGRRVRFAAGNVLQFETEEIEIPQGTMTPLSAGFLSNSAMVAGPDGVELVWWSGTSNRLQHLWIPWGFGEPVIATELDVQGYLPSLHRDGDTTTLVVTAYLVAPQQQVMSWTGHDPANVSDAFRVDLEAADGSNPSQLDADGRLVFVDLSGRAAFLSDVDPLEILAFSLGEDGSAEIDFSGPAFGLFDLEASLDLSRWDPSLSPAVTLDGNGRATLGDIDTESARFWRGIYRTR